MVRIAVAMSAISRKPVKIYNIRGKRPNPGLKSQHLNAIAAVAELCNARVEGLKLNSREIEFYPGDEIVGKSLRIDVGTAGATTLILQAVTPVAAFASGPVSLELIGGTDVPFSAPVDYYKNVLVKLFQKFNLKMELQVVRRGFYPRGGGMIKVSYTPMEMGDLRPVELLERGNLLNIYGISFASSELSKGKVAERQALSAKQILVEKFKKDVEIFEEYKLTKSPGSGIVLWAEFSNTVIGADALGELGKLAEKVGREAAEELIREIELGACVDKHAADNLIPFMAVAGRGVIKTSEVTLHTRTNIWVCEHFFPGKFKIEGSIIKYG